MSTAGESLSLTWAARQALELDERPQSAEAALVRRAQASDEMAFREIVERYQARVLSVIHRIVQHTNDEEDIAQQVFVKVYFSIRAFECRSSLPSWIYRIAVNECYEYLRRKKVRPLVYHSDFKEEDARRLETRQAARTQPSFSDAALAQRDFAVKLLARLPQEQRYLLLMKEVEGYSIEELSQMTGIKENSIKVKLFRARRKLLEAAARRGLMPVC